MSVPDKFCSEASEPLVIVCWTRGRGRDLLLHTLVHRIGKGGIRVYEKDKYDLRAGPDLPFFDDAKAALSYMMETGQLCQVAVEAAVRGFGYERRELDYGGCGPCDASVENCVALKEGEYR